MNIQSTLSRPAQLNRRELGKEFQAAKEDFQTKAADHSDRFESYEKWGTRIGFGLGAGVLVGGASLMLKFAPGVEGYGMAFPPVLAAAATVGIAWKVTNMMLENKLEESDFQQTRETLVEKRDQYRESLLAEVDDAEVSSITGARWNELRAREDQNAPTPTRAEKRLLTEVEELEFLANGRQSDGWLGALAHAQDDPKVFVREADTVQSNGGIHKVMVDAFKSEV